jgi:hypothetical protein
MEVKTRGTMADNDPARSDIMPVHLFTLRERVRERAYERR